jgi:hypothetical protein
MWSAFKSLQFGIFLLACIGAVAIYGTMHYAANDSLGDQAIPLAKARVFNAWWFFGLLALFFVQFITSTWHVTVMSFGIWKKADFGRSKGYITGPGEGRASVDIPDGPSTSKRSSRRSSPAGTSAVTSTSPTRGCVNAWAPPSSTRESW